MEHPPEFPHSAPHPGPTQTAPSVALADPDATERLGERLGRFVRGGDRVLLSGPLGVGKSALARAIVHAILGDRTLDVPSPSYTLVNIYDGPDFAIWHADLYRIADLDEIEELGLGDIDDRTLLLLEWPERWPDVARLRHMAITLGFAGDGRHAALSLYGQGWADIRAVVGA